ncbi:MAG: hypothetical protein WBD31_09660 [Rubripirellula sp.]
MSENKIASDYQATPAQGKTEPPRSLEPLPAARNATGVAAATASNAMTTAFATESLGFCVNWLLARVSDRTTDAASRSAALAQHLTRFTASLIRDE